MSKLSLTFSFLLLGISLNAQFLWQQNYPNLIEENHVLKSHVVTSDGDFLIFGSQKINPGLDPKFLQKIDDQGNLLWRKVIDSLAWGVPTGVCSTLDGNFMTSSATTFDSKLIKVTPDGEVIWSMEHEDLGRGNIPSGNQMTATSEGGFLITGSEIQNNNHLAIMVLKTDSQGQEIWKNKYFATSNQDSEEYGTTIFEVMDGGILVAGVSTTTNDMILLKLDKDGNQLWSQIYDYSDSFEVPTQIEPSPEGDGFYILGMKNDLMLNKPTVLKIDLDGNAEWQNDYGEGTIAELSTAMTFTSDCNMIITHSEDTDQSVASLLIKLDLDGNELCTYLLDQGANTDCQPLAISEKSNEEFIVMGTIKECLTCTSQIFSLGTTNICDSLNCVTSVLDQSILSSISIYPNPTNEFVFIQSKQNVDFEISIYNTLGEEVFNTTFTKERSIDVSLLKKGVYLIDIFDESSRGRIQKKIVIQ